MFLKNCWYVAAWDHEISDGLLARTILDRPVVLFRGPDCTPHALEDRCCHRGLPLSLGRVREDTLQCGYHGLEFDFDGTCVVVPGQSTIPPEARVRSYPVIEKWRWVWIWMGDPALAYEIEVIPYPFHDQPDKWPHRKEVFRIKANYMLMVDNLMDLTHLGYVHTKTIGGDPNTHVAAEMESRPTENGAHFIRWMPDCEPPPTFVRAAGFTGRVDRWQEFEYVAPGIVLQWSGGIDVGQGARENRDQEGLHWRLLHGATPETETTFHYFWSAANGYRQDDPQATQEMYDEIYPSYTEDKNMMEAQQRRIDLDPARGLVAIHSDSALALARIAIDRMIEKDQARIAQAAE